MSVIQINGSDYQLKKMSPVAIASIANILGRLSVDGRKYLTTSGLKNSDSFVWGVLAVVTGEDLIKFASALTGAPVEYVTENFDVSWVIAAVEGQMELSNINSLLKNFTSGSSQNQL